MMADDERLLQEAVNYFKERPGLHRLMLQVKRKYQSLNVIGGTAIMTNLSPAEKEDLGLFFNKMLDKQQSFSVKIIKIEETLSTSRFAGVSLIDLLEGYFGERILANKVIEEQFVQQRRHDFLQFLEMLEESQAKSWLSAELSIDSSFRRWIYQKYRENEESCLRQLELIVVALNRILVAESTSKKIAQFAAEVSGNPHYFDIGTEGEKWLTMVLNRMSGTSTKSNSAEARTDLYFKYGLIRDTLSNHTFCYQIDSFVAEDEVHLGINGYNQMDEPHIVTLESLSLLMSVKCHNQRVYVAENPTIFHNLITERSNKQALSLMCTNGQLTVASLLLLDLIAKSGATIYYSGDFDPEGLRIADRLKERYGSQLKFWRYSEADYHAALSKEVISASRITKLNGLKDSSLQTLADTIRKVGYSAYQESIFSYYLKDVECLIE